MPDRRPMSRRRFLRLAAAGAATLLTGHSVAEVYRFVLERHRLELPGLRAPVRLAFLTDLHYGPFVREASVAAWVDATLAEDPDLIVLGGDLVDYLAGPDLAPLVRTLGRLRAPLGTYCVWGNHEHARGRDLRAFAGELAEGGIRLLRNEGTVLRDDLHLAGLDDYRWGRPDLRRALAGRVGGAATVLISHNPDVLPEVPEWVGLTLAGHTHGGQVRLPLIGAVVTSSAYGQRFAAGWARGPALGYVSRGLGVGLVPVRLDCPAELTVLELAPLGG